jgi:hypothetical protein
MPEVKQQPAQVETDEIWSKQMLDLQEEKNIESELTNALIGLQNNGVTIDQLDYAIAALTRAQNFLYKYTPDLKIVDWAINRLERQDGDEIEIFNRVSKELIMKLGKIGFRIPNRTKPPWTQKTLEERMAKSKKIS